VPEMHARKIKEYDCDVRDYLLEFRAKPFEKHKKLVERLIATLY